MASRLRTIHLVSPLLVALMGCSARSSLIEGSGGDGGAGSATTHATGTASTAAGPSSTGSGCMDEVIATASLGATALALDGNDVFWGTKDGHVLARVGGVTTTLASGLDPVVSIAVDASRVYYKIGVSIVAVPRGGGSPMALATDPDAMMVLADDGVVFYLKRGLFDDGGIVRVGADGIPQQILTGLSSPAFMAADADYVYADAQSGAVGGLNVQGLVVRAPKDGGPPELIAGGLQSPGGFALSADRVYVIDQFDGPVANRGLRSVAKTGGPITNVAETLGLFPLDVAVDGTNAYLTASQQMQPMNPNTAVLRRIALDGSSQTDLASTVGAFYTWVLQNDTAVFWTIDWTSMEPPPENATVRKKCK